MLIKETIKNPWCVYGGYLGLWDFGKITKEGKNSVHILYSEGQQYPSECWDPSWVKRFNKLEKAVEYYIKNRPSVDIRCSDYTDDEIRNLARQKFPSYFKK